MLRFGRKWHGIVGWFDVVRWGKEENVDEENNNEENNDEETHSNAKERASSSPTRSASQHLKKEMIIPRRNFRILGKRNSIPWQSLQMCPWLLISMLCSIYYLQTTQSVLVSIFPSTHRTAVSRITNSQREEIENNDSTIMRKMQVRIFDSIFTQT